MSIEIQLNGDAKTLDAPMSLVDLLQDFGLDGKKIAVERNLEIVPRSTYAEVIINDGDRLEIVRFVGGG